MPEPTRPSGPRASMQRTDFPLFSATMPATNRSTGAIRVPVGASLLRLFWGNNSAPAALTFTEAFSINGTYSAVRISGNNSTIGSTKAFGNSTSIAGTALVTDLAGSRFIKVISSKVNGNARNFYFVCAG